MAVAITRTDPGRGSCRVPGRHQAGGVGARRGGWLSRDSVSRPLSGAPAGFIVGRRGRGVTQGGRSPTGVRPDHDGETHAASARG